MSEWRSFATLLSGAEERRRGAAGDVSPDGSRRPDGRGAGRRRARGVSLHPADGGRDQRRNDHARVPRGAGRHDARRPGQRGAAGRYRPASRSTRSTARSSSPPRKRSRRRSSFVARRPKVFILRMRNVPAIDATAMRVLDDLHDSSVRRGIAFLIAGLHAQPLVALDRAGRLDRYGREQLFGGSWTRPS